MKNIFLISLFFLPATISVSNSNAQISILSQNFNADCATTAGSPLYWIIYNPPSTPDPQGKWHCMPADGRSGTPGIACTGTFGTGHNLDTSFLVTPLLGLYGYPGNIYLNFDSKTDIFHLGGRLTVRLYPDTPFVSISPHFDLTSTLTPVIGIPDSSDWVTHQVNLTSYKGAPFYIAFMYTSTTTTGSMWYLDNINTTTASVTLGIPGDNKGQLPLAVIGSATTSKIVLRCSAPNDGSYHMALYDMMGREVYKDQVQLKAGTNMQYINGLDLRAGMYFIKINDGNSFGATKVIVQ